MLTDSQKREELVAYSGTNMSCGGFMVIFTLIFGLLAPRILKTVYFRFCPLHFGIFSAFVLEKV